MIRGNVAFTASLIQKLTTLQREGKDASLLAPLQATLGGRVGHIDDRDLEGAITGVLAA